jgi:hypothetical protein
MKKITWTFDFETIQNCFLAIYVNIKDPSDMRIFEVSDFVNNFEAFIKFNNDLIKNQNYIVSFNGLHFDSQVAYYCLENYKMFSHFTGGEIARAIFKFVQELIDQKNKKGWLMYRPTKFPWNEIDLAAINNYNNKQKFASLKWLQFNMDWYNIIDMDCNPEDILKQNDIVRLTKYCINDNLSTRELLKHNLEQIEVRKQLSKHFGLKLQNLSEPKLVKAILQDLLAKDMDIQVKELKTMQTNRKEIHLRDVILPYVKFTTPSLQKTLGNFKSLVLDAENLKGSFKHKVTYRGLNLSFALGGIHGAKRGVYKSGKGMIIKSFDVKSYYPNLCIRNGWSPDHLPADIFCKRYEWFYNERLKYPKSNPLNYLYKIVLNSAFGLSNDNNSFLKDSLLTMRITCNGQLLLVQLMEKLCENIPGARPIMVNTDGGEIIFPKEHEPLYNKICKDWEEMTNLILEFEEYEQLIIWDVNNYIGVFKPYEIEYDKAKEMFETIYPKPLIKQKDGKTLHYPIKLKGRFEIDKALHKNKSFRIKPISIYNYFIHGVDPKVTVLRNDNIYNFCAAVRAKGEWKIIQTCIEDGSLYNQNTQKTIRYFVSSKGCKLIKRKETIAEEDIYGLNRYQDTMVLIHKKGDLIVKNIKVEAGPTLEQVAIKVDKNKPFSEYNINYDYYLKLIRSEIETVQPSVTQQKLF